MREFFKMHWPLFVYLGIIAAGVAAAIFVADRSFARELAVQEERRKATVTTGILLDGISAGLLTTRTYEVHRTVYLDSEGREVFRVEDTFETGVQP